MLEPKLAKGPKEPLFVNPPSSHTKEDPIGLKAVYIVNNIPQNL
jgi:hypothetical protein